MSKKILLVVFSLFITASLTGCYIDTEWDNDWRDPVYTRPVFAIASFAIQYGDNQSFKDNATFTVNTTVTEAYGFELYVREEGSVTPLPTAIYSHSAFASPFSRGITIRYDEGRKQLQQGSTFLDIIPGKKYLIVGRAYRDYGDFNYNKTSFIESQLQGFTLEVTPTP